MIGSFADKATEELWVKGQSRKFGKHQRVALRKLIQLDSVEQLSDLKTPPGNRLEALSGDRQGQHSIRVNKQWRICFIWKDGSATQVNLEDYH